MFAKTLTTAVLKTVTVAGVKLVAPADRIGQGGLAASANPTDNLSPGYVPVPPYPEPEMVRVQSLSAMQMRMHMPAAATTPTAGSAGCLRAPGASAVTSWSSSPVSFTGWRRTTRDAAVAESRKLGRSAQPSRTRRPDDGRHDYRTGSDCQSPGRVSDLPAVIRVASSAQTAKK